jgi:hypothetical protein
MTSDAEKQTLQRARRRRRARFVQRWFQSEAFFAPGTGRFQFPLSVLVIIVTWTAIALGTALWLNRLELTDALMRWVAVALTGAIGTLLIWTGVEHVLYPRRVLRWPQARARIVRYWVKRHYSDNDDVGQIHYYPVVTFRTVKGKEMVAISRSPSPSRRSWPRGAEVLVHYDPHNPVRVEIPSLLQSHLVLMLIVVLFGVGVAVGLIYLFLHRRG